MRCLYEVLGVAKDADESLIRKAYRKGALAWHPDKNQGNLEVADARFKEIQNAWEVLSDPGEKAWYDSHRDQILRAGRHQAGGDGGHEGRTTPPEDLSLFQYFSSSCYSGFNDGPKGFYTVYGKVFKDLASQEALAAEQIRDRQAHIAPAFGKADSPWSHVSAFYQYWLYFVSDRSFAWADSHNPASAPNRKVRRLMEDDNNKQRKAARREFQENVRALVAFVRKRDARVIAWMEQEEIKKAKHKAAEDRRREEESAERMRRALEYEEPDWVQAAEAGSCSSDGAAYIEDELYCIACDKFFKSDKALANHKRSKKHLQNAEILQAALADEEAGATPVALEHSLHLTTSSPQASQADVTNLPATSDEVWQGGDREHLMVGPEAEELSRAPSTAGSTVGSPNEPTVEISTGSDTTSESPQEDEEALLARMVQAHMQLGSRLVQKEETMQAGPGDDSHGPASRMGTAWPACDDVQDPGRAHIDVSHGIQMKENAYCIQEAEDTSSHPQPASRGLRLQRKHSGAQVATAHDQGPYSREETTALGGHDLNSSGLTRQANAVGAGTGEPALAELTGLAPENIERPHKLALRRKGRNPSARRKGGRVDTEGVPLTCQVCKEVFDTRNLLFRHIKEQGHARIVKP